MTIDRRRHQLATATAVLGTITEAMDAHGILVWVEGVTDEAELMEKVSAMWSLARDEVADLLDPNEEFDVEIVPDGDE